MSAFIFDFDGTMADTEKHHKEAFNKIFMKRFGKEFTDELYEKLKGSGERNVIIGVLKHYGIEFNESLLSELMEEKEEVTWRIIREKGWNPMPGLIDFLEKAKEEGISMAIASSARKALVYSFLNNYELWHYFKAIITSKDVEKLKPNPDLFLKALDALKVEKAIVFEDSYNGVLAAHKAGCPAVIVNNDKIEADMHIKDFKEGLDRWDEILSLI